MVKYRRHYIFHGDVQAVGFRYTACSLARQLGVTGWVRNCYDGTVEMEAQGALSELDELVSGISNDIYITVDDVEIDEIKLKDENDFHIVP